MELLLSRKFCVFSKAPSISEIASVVEFLITIGAEVRLEVNY